MLYPLLSTIITTNINYSISKDLSLIIIQWIELYIHKILFRTKKDDNNKKLCDILKLLLSDNSIILCIFNNHSTWFYN